MAKDRIAMAMSGGVDSSTAAAILKNKGFDVVGFSMQLWDQRRDGSQKEEARLNRCCSIENLYDARTVAAHLNIPHYVVNFQREFSCKVVQVFIESYRQGLTPSPCVLCNSHLKFDHLIQMAEEIEAPYVATGHYARISWDESSKRHLLLRARDKNKDQSYFLFELNQTQLAKAMFPLGGLTKEQVRRIARQQGLMVAEKPESQEICFIPDNDYASFIERHYDDLVELSETSDPFPAGQIVNTEGQVLGAHSGIHHFTIGQRRGLGIANPKPLYVLELCPEDNKVIVGERFQLSRLSCRVNQPNWISIPELTQSLQVTAKIRSRHADTPAIITPLDDGAVEVVFNSPQLAVTPGQACVFYQGERVVGGGWIARPHPHR